MRQNRFPIIVSGMIAGDPHQGGAAWAVLQYVLGLQRLGHDVYLIEPLSASSLRPAGAPLECSENAAYFRATTAAFGLEKRSSLLLENTSETVGLPYEELRRICSQAAALLNISGMLQMEDLIGHIPVRVYLDLDPAFNQLWHATQGIDMGFAMHNRFVTVGKSLGRPECSVPTCGIEWIATFQPVVREYCLNPSRILYHGMTTVANWRGYGSIHHEGVHYGQKAHSLRGFIDLPTRTTEEFLLALSIHPGEHKDLTALRSHGWRVQDPKCVAGTPRQYLNFVGASKAEFGIAKSGYVAARCGWFSDRSACYLAFGRPVVAQETGFSDFLPCGEGLFRFRTPDDVLAAIERINGDYARQSKVASEIASEYFESGKVLSNLMTAVGLYS
jgi:hypothetical protein